MQAPNLPAIRALRDAWSKGRIVDQKLVWAIRVRFELAEGARVITDAFGSIVRSGDTPHLFAKSSLNMRCRDFKVLCESGSEFHSHSCFPFTALFWCKPTNATQPPTIFPLFRSNLDTQFVESTGFELRFDMNRCKSSMT